MKKLYKITILSVLLTISASCNKMLEIDPKNYVIESGSYYNTEEDLKASVRGIFSILANMYGDFLQGRMGLEADEGFPAFAFDENTVSYYAVSANDDKILSYWRAFYRGINMANELLANINKPTMDESSRDEIRGQVLFLRGYFYFMLVNKFGGVPLILKPTLSGSNEELQVPRATAKEVYEQIIADMTAAEGLVKDISLVSGGGYISKSAVWGVLSRVCLYMAGNPVKDTNRYQEAADWAQKIMVSGHHALNVSYAQVFTNYAQDLYDKSESIWEVEFWGNGSGIYTNTGGRVGINNGILNTQDYDQGYSRGIVHPTSWLNSIYNAGDLRRDWNIPSFKYEGNPAQEVPEAAVWYRYCGKYRRKLETLKPKGSAVSPQNAPIVRYSDVLLMYAETTNEINNGPTEEAREAVNQVRRRGQGLNPLLPNPAVDIPTGETYLEFKEELMIERARELCFEGFRKNDLVRWGVLFLNMKNILPTTPGGNSLVARSARAVYTGVSERDVVWPIPTFEMNLNRKLVQNQGW